MISTAIKSAILRCTGVVVDDVFSSTDQVAVEMADLANEVATDIAKSHDWRDLTQIATVTGNAMANALPDDYDRMIVGGEVDNGTNWFWGYQAFDSVNDWMRYTTGTYPILSPGGWIVIGGELQFYPAPNGEARFPYISNAWAKNETGVRKNGFTSDNDSFVLDSRLLTLGLIWRWNEQKGFEYAEAMQTYETALAQAQGRDGGSKVLRTPSRHLMGHNIAYNGRAIR